jgi:hypothetical protein
MALDPASPCLSPDCAIEAAIYRNRQVLVSFGRPEEVDPIAGCAEVLALDSPRPSMSIRMAAAPRRGDSGIADKAPSQVAAEQSVGAGFQQTRDH